MSISNAACVNRHNVPWSPSASRTSATSLAASASSPAAKARSKSWIRTPKFVRLDSRQLARVLPRQLRVTKLDLDPREPVQESGPIGGGKMLAGLRQLRHRGTGRVAPLAAPVIQAGQLDV